MNNDSQINIIKAAMDSLTGNMIYRKWNRKEKRFQKKRYQVIPIDAGISKAGNPVLYAQDYRDNKQIKMFIITQIDEFEQTKRKARPAFPIQIDNLRRMFKRVKDEDLIDEENSQGIDENRF